MYLRTLCLLSVLFAVCLATLLPQKVLAYSSGNPAYSVSPPAGWKTETVDRNTVRFFPTGKSVRFIVETVQDNTQTLTDFAKASYSALTSGLADPQFIYQNDANLAGVPALEMRIDALEDGVPALQLLTFVCVKNNTGYRISAFDAGGILEDYLPDFQNFVKSFSFSPKVAFPYRDDFNGSFADSDWYTIRADDIGLSLTAKDGFLSISTGYGDLWGSYNNAKNILLRPAPSGNYEITAALTFTPAFDGQQAGLLIYENDDSYLMLSRSRSHEGNILISMENGIDSDLWQTPFDSSVSFLRLVHNGDKYSAYSSRDGTTWDKLHEYAGLTFSNPKIGIAAFQPVQVEPAAARFDFFTLTEVTVNQPPAASFAINPLNPSAGNDISFASVSADPDNDTLSYAWYLDGSYLKNIGNNPLWTWAHAPAGKHTVKLVVNDGKGGISEYSQDFDLQKTGGIPLTWIIVALAAIVLIPLLMLVIARRKK